MKRERQAAVRMLVTQLLNAGCDIWAVGNRYTVDDTSTPEQNEIIREILAAFGPRDHLVREISDCLRSMGRCCDDASI